MIYRMINNHTPQFISIVVPIYNEEDCLDTQLQLLVKVWKKHIKLPFELVLIENGSTDRSWSILTRFKEQNSSFVRLLRLSKASYGQALKAGILESKGKFILCVDVDYFDFNFIKKALDLMQKNRISVIVGSKLHPVSVDKRSVDRRLATRSLRFLFRTLFRYRGTDTHGLKVFINSFELKQCVRQCVTQNELVDSELLLRLSNNYQVKLLELPVVVEEMRRSRYVSAVRYFRAAMDLWKMILVGFFGGYKKAEVWPVVVDDYGWSKATDQIIFREIKRGGITRVSVLANMATKSQMALLRRLQENGVQISLHLNFVEGVPVLPITQVPSLVDANGTFFSLPYFIFCLLLGRISKNELERELLAQYRRLESVVSVGHLDSHQHTHQFRIIRILIDKNFVLLKQPLVRSFKSSYLYLVSKPLRFIVFIVLEFMLRGSIRRIKLGEVNESIVHIGFQYD